MAFLGPAAGKAAKEALKRNGARRDRREQLDAAAIETARVIATGDPELGRQTLLDIERAKTRRTLVRAGVGIVAVGGLVAAGIVGFDQLKSLAPHTVTVTQEQVGAALNRVQLRDETTILSGEGHGSASLSSETKFCALGHCLTIPGTGEHAAARVDAELDVISRAGAISLRGEKSRGRWRAVATINPNGLGVKLSDPQDTLSGNDDPPMQMLNALGINSDQNGRDSAAISIAQTNFEASCSPALVPDIADAEAGYIRNQIKQEATLLQGSDPTGFHILQGMTAWSNPIDIQFAYPAQASDTSRSSQAYVSPSTITIPVPRRIKSSETTVQIGSTELVMDVTTASNCLETVAAAAEISQYAHAGGYVLNQP